MERLSVEFRFEAKEGRGESDEREKWVGRKTELGTRGGEEERKRRVDWNGPLNDRDLSHLVDLPLSHQEKRESSDGSSRSSSQAFGGDAEAFLLRNQSEEVRTSSRMDEGSVLTLNEQSMATEREL